MIIVKITVFLILITALINFIAKNYYSSNPREAFKIGITGNFPKWFYVFALLLVLDVIGIIASAIYLLFVR